MSRRRELLLIPMLLGVAAVIGIGIPSLLSPDVPRADDASFGRRDGALRVLAPRARSRTPRDDRERSRHSRANRATGRPRGAADVVRSVTPAPTIAAAPAPPPQSSGDPQTVPVSTPPAPQATPDSTAQAEPVPLETRPAPPAPTVRASPAPTAQAFDDSG